MNVTIVYSSVGGNTALVCEAVAESLEAQDITVHTARCQTIDPQIMTVSDLIILACPTYGQGTLEADFAAFLKSISAQDWSHQDFAIIGLGDTKYYPEYLTEAAQLLADWVQKQDGDIIGRPLRIGKPPLSIIQTIIPRWADKLAAELTNKNTISD